MKDDTKERQQMMMVTVRGEQWSQPADLTDLPMLVRSWVWQMPEVPRSGELVEVDGEDLRVVEVHWITDEHKVEDVVISLEVDEA